MRGWLGFLFAVFSKSWVKIVSFLRSVLVKKYLSCDNSTIEPKLLEIREIHFMKNDSCVLDFVERKIIIQ